MSDGLKYGAKFTSIPGALAAIRRGAFLPYFGKQGAIMPPFPHEQKRAVLRDFPVLALISGVENGAQFGLIPSQGLHPLIPGIPDEG